jgi:hypothetical protein
VGVGAYHLGPPILPLTIKLENITTGRPTPGGASLTAHSAELAGTGDSGAGEARSRGCYRFADLACSGSVPSARLWRGRGEVVMTAGSALCEW